jgi:hypothetical protein
MDGPVMFRVLLSKVPYLADLLKILFCRATCFATSLVISETRVPPYCVFSYFRINCQITTCQKSGAGMQYKNFSE